MTTGNDPALNDDGQHQAPVDPNQPSGQQPPVDGGDKGPGLTFTHPQPEELDSDDLALQKIIETVQAEEAGSNGSSQQPKPGDVTDPKNGAQPNTQSGQPSPADQQQQQQPAGEAIMVPKARLDSVLSERDKLREQVAFLAGSTQALQQQRAAAPAQAGQQPPQQQQQPATPEQRLADIATRQDALAKKFDDGEITMADFKREERTLDDQAQAIREEKLAAKLAPARNQAEQNDRLYLDQLTAQLEKDHPWVTTFSEFADKSGSDAEWDYVANLARGNLKSKGIVLNGSETAKYALRKEIAVLCDTYGPALLAERAKALGVTIPGSQQPPNGQQQQQLPSQAEARKKALEKAANAPPDLASLNGNPGDPAGTMSDDRLENIKEDEFDNMPAAVRNKLLGISA